MRNKIGFFAFGQVGDVAACSSVLKYKEQLWPDSDIVWFINQPNSELLKHQDIEIRPWLHGWEIPESDLNTIYAERIKSDKDAGRPNWENWAVLRNSENKLNQDLKHLFESTKDLSDGYFPLPHMLPVERRFELEYSNVSKRIFGVPDDWEWHPFLKWNEEEKDAVKSFASSWKQSKKTILLETFAGSGQSPFYTAETTKEIMRVCREKFDGDVTFVFGSHKHIGGENNIGFLNSDLFDRDDRSCISAGYLTPRLTALLINHVDLFIGISSGISVTTSAWGLKPTPKLVWCGSHICSTKAISNGPYHLVEAEFKTKEVATKEFFEVLNNVLETI